MWKPLQGLVFCLYLALIVSLNLPNFHGVSSDFCMENVQMSKQEPYMRISSEVFGFGKPIPVND